MFGFILVVFCFSLSVIDKLLGNLNIKHRKLLKKDGTYFSYNSTYQG